MKPPEFKEIFRETTEVFTFLLSPPLAFSPKSGTPHANVTDGSPASFSKLSSMVAVF